MTKRPTNGSGTAFINLTPRERRLYLASIKSQQRSSAIETAIHPAPSLGVSYMKLSEIYPLCPPYVQRRLDQHMRDLANFAVPIIALGSSRALAIYGSARTPVGHVDYVNTQLLSARFTGLGWYIITGAGPGIMEAATGVAGENAIGYRIRLPKEKVDRFADLFPEMVGFPIRQDGIYFPCDAAAVIPGGLGTSGETWMGLTEKQTATKGEIPMWAFFDDETWDIEIQQVMDLKLRRGFIDEKDPLLIKQAKSVEDIVIDTAHRYSNYQGHEWLHGTTANGREAGVLNFKVTAPGNAPDVEMYNTLFREGGHLVEGEEIQTGYENGDFFVRLIPVDGSGVAMMEMQGIINQAPSSKRIQQLLGADVDVDRALYLASDKLMYKSGDPLKAVISVIEPGLIQSSGELAVAQQLVMQ